jgi:outer membrane protein TolC
MKKYMLIICVLFARWAGAQNTELKTLINDAFTYFPKLKEIQQNEQIANERLKGIESNRYPTVNGSVGYNYVNPVGQANFPVAPGITRTLQFQPNNNINAAVTANYTLLDFGRLKASIAKSKEELNYHKQNTLYNKSQLASQVATIYYASVYLQKAILIQDSVIAYFISNKELIEKKLAHGDALKVDLYNIQASIDNELNRKVDLENSLQKQLNLLEFTTGKSAISSSDFTFETKQASVEELAKLAQNQSAEYNLIRSKLAQNQSDVTYNKKQLTPTLNATAATGFRNGYQPDISETRFNYLAGVTLNVPIYTGGKTKSQIGVATQSLKQTELSLQALDNQYRKDIKQALTDIESNTERIQNSQSQIAAAKAVVELTQSRYNNGVATYLDLIYATNSLQRAVLSKLQFEYQLCGAKIELARLTGEQYW